MKYAWKLGRIAGIDVYLHWTFLIVPAWVAVGSLASGAGIAPAITATIFVLAVFTCVLLHELGHALMAARYGIATRDITLLPIGGLARLDRMPASSAQELAVSLAGPLVNLAIAASLIVGQVVAGYAGPFDRLDAGRRTALGEPRGREPGLGRFQSDSRIPDGWRPRAARFAGDVCFPRPGYPDRGGHRPRPGNLPGTGGLVRQLEPAFRGCLCVHRGSERGGGSRVFQGHCAQPVRTAEDSPYLFLPAEARAEEVARVLFTQQFYFPVMQGGTVIGILSRPMLLWALTHGRKDRLVAELMSVRGEPSAVKYQK